MSAPPDCTVLLVDDDASVLTLLQHTLSLAGYLVLVASDGREAISCFESHGGAIDLLITDVQMPGMGGQELARHFLRTHSKLPIVFISGDSDEEILPNAEEFPRHLFFHKPFLPSELLAQLPDILK
jgi:CheY-like chemotaxis protein